jgi:hypothetical protein
VTARGLLALTVAVAIAVPAGAADAKLPADIAEALAKAERFEVLSLDIERLNDPPPGAFHGYKVLGKATVKDDAVRKQVIGALEKAVADGESPRKCFWPRHGIRATRGEKTVDLVICFQCAQMYVYQGDKAPAILYPSRSPEPVLDKVLKDAGVPLAPKADK